MAEGIVIYRDNGTERFNLSKRITRVLNNGQPIIPTSGVAGSQYDPELTEGTPWFFLRRSGIQFVNTAPYIYFDGPYIHWSFTITGDSIIYGVY